MVQMSFKCKHVGGIEGVQLQRNIDKCWMLYKKATSLLKTIANSLGSPDSIITYNMHNYKKNW